MIRRATPDDAYTLTRLRHALWDELNPDHPSQQADSERLYVYWYETIEAGATVAWLDEDAGRSRGMVALLLQAYPPLPTTENRRGYLSALYVVPAYRRQGVGQALMETVIGFAQEHGLRSLELRTSEAARPLYDALGFKSHEILTLRTGG
jgi:ribosomal protein S18 acetylase RimI-like enzyme